MAFDPFSEPSYEQRRELDAAALARELAELRALPRDVVRSASTGLTLAASTLAQNAKPEEAAAVLHAARVLYVIANETLTLAVCSTCGKHVRPSHVTELVIGEQLRGYGDFQLCGCEARK